MTEKRFENRLDKSNVKFNTLNPVWDNEKEDALNVFKMVDLLNELNDENEQLKSRVEYLERKIDRERTSYQKQHEKWEEEIQKENEQLKYSLSAYQIDLNHYKDKVTELEKENKLLRTKLIGVDNLVHEIENYIHDIKYLIYFNNEGGLE